MVYKIPNCPKCGLTMAQRKARQGPNVGNLFWGCSNFPKCKGTRPMVIKVIPSKIPPRKMRS